MKNIKHVCRILLQYIMINFILQYCNNIIIGPMLTTLVDFWRLIWQEHPPTIVMVTNVMEGNRIKCQQYWPESGKQQFGPFQVIITDQQIFADYTIRTLSVSVN